MTDGERRVFSDKGMGSFAINEDTLYSINDS